tara:strand:- start:39391 stop:41070 length:1680 start_codon:yes stop_codon:yes gene_type:complete
MAINVLEELELCRQEESERAPMDSWWQSIKQVAVPRDAYITRTNTPVPSNSYANIHDTTIIEAVEGLHNMMTAQFTPAGEQWISYQPPFEFEDDDEVREWYLSCSHITMKLVNQSNFNMVIQSVNLERASVGTGMMMCYETGDKSGPFYFKHSHVGTYTFQEDLQGRADTLRRWFMATANQLTKEFPNGNFGPKVQTAMADEKKRNVDKFKIWHVVKKRDERDPEKIDNVNMPYAEFYLGDVDKNLIEETGMHEFNTMVSRFQHGADGIIWGVSPARKAMPAVAQVNYLQESLDLLLDIKINPRILAEAGMVGEIDMRPGQKTLTRAGALSSANGGVREWMTGGDYPLGKDRIKDKQDQIRKLFFNALWQPYADVQKEMTATEFEGIKDQSEMLFVGVNARFEEDIRPMLSTRLFGICLRQGLYPPPPQQLLKEVGGSYEFPDPLTTFETNLSRVMKRKLVQHQDQFFLRLQQYAQVDSTVLDEIDLAAHTRELARVYGFRKPLLRPEEEVIQIAQARLQAQAQQEQQQEAMAVADTASKFAPDVQNQMLEQAQGATPS